MSSPRPLSETELSLLDDAALFAYLVACRDAGMGKEATQAMWFFLAGRLDDIVAKLETKLPPDVADEQATIVIAKASQATFDGAAIAQLHKLLSVIISRVIADYHRGREGEQLRRDREGAALRREEDDAPPETPVIEHGYDLVDAQLIIGPILEARPPKHREAIELFLIHDRPAKEVAERTGLSEANVNQVVKRFREDCGS